MKKFAKRIIVTILVLTMILQCAWTSRDALKVHASENDDLSYSAQYVIKNWGTEPQAVDGKIFAGWYQDAEYTEAVKKKPSEYIEGQKFYAKYVDEGIFSVKLQLEKLSNGTYNIRLISSVDSLDYKMIGFDVTFKGQTMKIRSNSVFKSIDSVYMDKAYTYSSKVVDADSEYMFTNIIKNVSSNDVSRDFYVVPCVKTYDGVISYGPSRMFSVSDGMSDETINLSLIADKPMTSTVKVTVDEEEVTAEVVGHSDDGYLHLNVPANRAELDSNVEVTYGDASCTYHNLESEKSVDTSWYDANADKYVLTTVADLYGLRELVNVNQLTFSGKSIYLINDLEINEIDEDTVDSWVAGTAEATKKWIPIGYNGTVSSAGDSVVYFDGVFDGQGHTIRGLYGTAAAAPVGGSAYMGFGLFTGINSNGSVKNLTIDDCYFKANVNFIGFIAGILYGTVENVSVGSNSYLCDKKLGKGGIAGRTYGATISNVMYEGNIQQSPSNGYVGGLIGQANSGTTCISNCMVKGNLHLTTAGSYGNAGLVGHMFGSSAVVVENTIFAGNVISETSDVTGIGAIAGTMATGATLSMKNVYLAEKPVNTSGTVIEEESGVAGVGTLVDGGSIVYGKAEYLTNIENPYQTFNLDFYDTQSKEGVWVVSQTQGVLPELKTFSDISADDILQATNEVTPSRNWFDSCIYEISTIADLYGLADLVNHQGETMEGITISLANDIDLNYGWDASENTAPENGREWISIGTKAHPFKGTFTGKNYTIRGIYMTAQEGYQGLFGNVEDGVIKNLHVENSFYDLSGKATEGYEGGLVGKITDGKIYNVHVNINIQTINGYTGGIAGSTVSASVDNSSYMGVIQVQDTDANVTTGYGKIVGYAEGKLTVSNCLSTADMNIAREGTTFAGGMIGSIAEGAEIKVHDSLSAGIVSFGVETERQNSGFELQLSDVYTTTETTETGMNYIANGLADALTTECADIWINKYQADGNAVHPVLRETDGTIRVLLIGNSFCYYHTDELYGMLAMDERDAIVANVYESGCPVKDHWTWLNSGAEKYNYITVTEKGRVDSSYHSLKYCLEQEDWDVISLQQHFNPGTADTYQACADSTLSYAKYLYDYLKENYPEAKLLWQQTWAYQKGYQGPSGKVSEDETQWVLTDEKQTTNYENIRDTAIAVCDENNVLRVPNGDAWQLARSVVGDILCNKSGTDLASDTVVGDNYHDGDIGGGQLLNAYGFYELITGKDCRDNSYRPPYVASLIVNTDFNSELTSVDDMIQALKEAAHTAVLNMNQ